MQIASDSSSFCDVFFVEYAVSLEERGPGQIPFTMANHDEGNAVLCAGTVSLSLRFRCSLVMVKIVPIGAMAVSDS